MDKELQDKLIETIDYIVYAIGELNNDSLIHAEINELDDLVKEIKEIANK